MQSSLNRASTKRSLQRLKDARWMARVRQRLQSLSWFMKGLTRQGRKSEIRNSKSETNPKFKVQMPKDSVLPRRGPTSADHWQSRLKKLSHGRLLGVFASSRQRLRDVRERLGLRRMANLGGCPAEAFPLPKERTDTCGCSWK